VGSFVAEVIAECGLDCRLVRHGIADMPRGVTGSPDYLYRRAGLTAGQVARATVKTLDVVQR
jgi:transketolase C-terminal domain/subunit